jgi:protein-S-isoprenylcysteine O-methyltransferase Ste14
MVILTVHPVSVIFLAMNVLSVLLFLLLLLSLAAPALSVVCHVLTPLFDGKILTTVTLVAVMVEKVWAMFFRMRARYSSSVKQDWTSVSVGYAYAAVVYAVILDYYSALRQPAAVPVVICGATVYALAVALRYWAFDRLGHQWAVHVDKPLGERHLVTDGPYSLIRHPLYTGAILETLGLPLMVGSWIALCLAVVVFLPLEIQRAYFEERYLRRIFGSAYNGYVASTWAFFPLPRRKSAPARPARERGEDREAMKER